MTPFILFLIRRLCLLWSAGSPSEQRHVSSRSLPHESDFGFFQVLVTPLSAPSSPPPPSSCPVDDFVITGPPTKFMVLPLLSP